MTPEEKIQKIVDKHEIYDLMVHYAERIDAKDPAGAAACFAEDGIGVYWGDYKGPKAIAERLTWILDQFAASSYHLSNVQIKLDRDKATSLSYLYAYHRLVETNEPTHYWGRWIDALRKDKGRWLFTRREVVGVGSMGTVDDDLTGLAGHPGRL